ncbi:MAG: hypothetical protein ACH37Z_17645 [Anaerolineae bacterium]|nr:hypothetical protein [Ardenticatenia bacterium]
MPIFEISVFVLYALILFLPFWIVNQVKAIRHQVQTNHEAMIQGFAECMDALGHLGRRLQKMEQAAGGPPPAAASGAAASTEPVSTDPDPS